MSTKLSAKIGLGTFPFASPFTPVSESDVEKILKAFIELGGQYIDTAPTYAFGETENIVGRIIKKIDPHHKKFYIAAMCGHALDENRQFKKSGKYNDVISSCNASLKRLQVDNIDLYISHTPDLDTPFSETISAMEELKKQGKILQIGVSNVTLEQLREYNANGLVKYVENRFSLLNRNFSSAFIDYCHSSGIGIIAFQAIERGLLTNKVVEGITLRDGDLRNKKPEFAQNIRDEIGMWVKNYLKPLADQLGISVSALSLWWVIQQPEIAVALNGATREEQLRANLKALSIQAPADTLGRIEDAYHLLEEKINQEYSKSVRSFMGLDQVAYKSPSGK